MSAFGYAEWGTTSGVFVTNDESWETTKLLAGIKLNLGTRTLIERDRFGASLDPLPSEVNVFETL